MKSGVKLFLKNLLHEKSRLLSSAPFAATITASSRLGRKKVLKAVDGESGI
jgi:hypothetical protein